jgi:hypothetical protein
MSTLLTLAMLQASNKKNNLLKDLLVGWSFDGNILEVKTGANLLTSNNNNFSFESTNRGIALLNSNNHFFQLNNPGFNSGENITMCCWVYPTQNKRSGYFYSGGFADGQILGQRDQSDSNLLIQAYVNTTNVQAGTIVLNQWNHCAASWDGLNYTLFVNGVERVKSQVIGGYSSTDIWRLLMSTDSARIFVGYIQNMYIYKRALSNEEIIKVMSIRY